MMSLCFATDKKVSLSLISTAYSDRRFLMEKNPKTITVRSVSVPKISSKYSYSKKLVSNKYA